MHRWKACRAGPSTHDGWYPGLATGCRTNGAAGDKLVKFGARIVRHGRNVVFQLAEVAVPRALFVEILRWIDGLRPKPPPFAA